MELIQEIFGINKCEEMIMEKISMEAFNKKKWNLGKKETNMSQIAFHITLEQVEYLNRMVKSGFFATRSEAFRYCITRLMEENKY